MPMNVQSILERRRDGQGNSRDELEFLARGAGNGSIPDYQLSAWLMAAFLKPLSADETAWLTMGMAASGERLDLSGLPHPWLDKHSTGGVGDKTSIAVLPILAACGLTVVKMSGRGLGITGGTVDKLASVPGLRLDLSPAEMVAQARSIGIALTGQTPDLAPADKALYALRDVTATVPSIPLIVSSILSKKLAGGAEIVVLDVKCGRGAFMKTLEEARALSAALVETGKRCGLAVHCAITDMDQPLGRSIGNANEVAEAIEVLQGKVAPTRSDASDPAVRFASLAFQLSVEALSAAGFANESELVENALASGAALRKLAEWFQAQGASAPVWSDVTQLPQPAARRIVRHAGPGGWVASIDAEAFGRAVIELGGGRHRKEDSIDPTVGIEMGVAVGSKVEPGAALFEVFAGSETAAANAEASLAHAIRVSDAEIAPRALILESVR